jgi:hypothetical protein
MRNRHASASGMRVSIAPDSRKPKIYLGIPRLPLRLGRNFT